VNSATLPDRILAYLRSENGLVTDHLGQIEALIASQVGEREVDKVSEALKILQRGQLVHLSTGKKPKVSLTRKGWEHPVGGEVLQQRVASNEQAALPEFLEAVEPAAFARMRSTRCTSLGGRVVEAFLSTGEAAVLVRPDRLDGRIKGLRSSIDTYLRTRNLKANILVRVSDGNLYLARADLLPEISA
jgi:hypothetical protein